MSTPRWSAAALILVVAGFVLAAGCARKQPTPPPAKPADVLVQKAAVKEIIDTEDFTGRLEAFKKVDIQARVTGFLKEIYFEEGGKVEKDKPLFKIDPRPYKAELDKADAAVVQAQARFNRLEGDLERAKGLLKTNSISKEEYEKIDSDHAEAKAAVGVAKASRDSAQLFYDYTEVKSPITGVVSRSLLDPGNLVKADMTVLTTVVTQAPVYAYFDVDERTHIKLTRLAAEGRTLDADKKRVPVQLALADEEDFAHTGTLDFEDTLIDPATGTRRMRGKFDNEAGLFTPGMFVRIRLQIGKARKAVVIAEQGIGTDQGQKFVYVVGAGDKVEYRKIETGPLIKGERVIEKGLSAGERVIVSGLQKVRTNAVVAPKEEPLPEVKISAPPKVTVEEKK